MENEVILFASCGKPFATNGAQLMADSPLFHQIFTSPDVWGVAGPPPPHGRSATPMKGYRMAESAATVELLVDLLAGNDIELPDYIVAYHLAFAINKYGFVLLRTILLFQCRRLAARVKQESVGSTFPPLVATAHLNDLPTLTAILSAQNLALPDSWTDDEAAAIPAAIYRAMVRAASRDRTWEAVVEGFAAQLANRGVRTNAL